MRVEADSHQGPSAYQPDALPLGWTSSLTSRAQEPLWFPSFDDKTMCYQCLHSLDTSCTVSTSGQHLFWFIRNGVFFHIKLSNHGNAETSSFHWGGEVYSPMMYCEDEDFFLRHSDYLQYLLWYQFWFIWTDVLLCVHFLLPKIKQRLLMHYITRMSVFFGFF